MTETSASAFHAREASGDNSTAREVALRALTKFGPGTCLEIYKHMRVNPNADEMMSKSDLSTRFNELRMAGLAAQIGKRKSFGVGHLSILWSVRDPEEHGVAPVRLSKAGRIKELEGIVNQQKAQITILSEQLATAAAIIKDFHDPLFRG